MPKAKLFTNGGSQAVRLPAELRFEGDDVDVRRDPVSGDVILSKPHGSWDEYFTWVASLDLPKDFMKDLMSDREQPVDDFRDPFVRSGEASAAKRG